MDDRFSIRTDWTSKDNAAVRNAFELANYQMKVRRQAIRAMETDKQVRKKSREYKKEIIADFTDWTYGCMALVMHRVYGWGARRISNMLEALEVQRAELIDNGMESSQIWDIIRNEIGLDITIVDGFDWNNEEE